MFKHLVIALGTAWLTHAAQAQAPAPVLAPAQPASEAASAAPSPFYTEAADCTAAFEARVIELKAQPRSETRNQAIRHDTELGFVYVGVAYKRGLRNPEADDMLKAAEKRWHQLSKADQAKRLSTCTAQAEQLMQDVSGLERFIVRNRADARVDRLLEKEAGAAP